MHAKFVRRVAPWIIASLAGGTFVAVAGPLDPPSGPISSTYKTLTEVEPRIAVNSTNTPGSRDCKFRISQPGSYYLTSDVGAAFLGGGIEIAADGVTLDLMGYTVRGAADSTHGIYTDVSRRGITIRNGVVTGWDQDGIFIKGLQARVEGVTATLNLGDGINLESTAVVRGCVAANNGGNGIVTFDHVLVESCLARDNGSYGSRSQGVPSLPTARSTTTPPEGCSRPPLASLPTPSRSPTTPRGSTSATPAPSPAVLPKGTSPTALMSAPNPSLATTPARRTAEAQSARASASSAAAT